MLARSVATVTIFLGTVAIPAYGQQNVHEVWMREATVRRPARGSS